MSDADMFPQHGRRELIVGLITALASTALLVGAYFVLPFDRRSDASFAVVLTVALAVFTALLLLQVRSILKAPYPVIRALEALGVLVPLLLVIFAATYFLIERNSPGSFTEDLSRLDALYFTVTVFATVGFGDISAVTPSARAIVLLQMVVNLLVLGAGLRLITSAVKRRRREGVTDEG